MGLFEKAEKGKQGCPGAREPGTQYPTLAGRITARSLAGKSMNGKKQKVECLLRLVADSTIPGSPLQVILILWQMCTLQITMA